MSKVRVMALIVLILAIIFFIIGSTTGTIEGYQGADGQYYSNPGAVGSNEWMCMPSFIVGAIAAVVLWITKENKS